MTHEFADYFTLQEYIAELVRQGYLAKDDGLYVPTKLGKDSLSYFKKRVPLSVRKGILGTVKVYIRKQRLKKEVVAEVVMLNELDCAARCAVYDSNQPLFEILINAGDKATAHKICRKFKDDPKAVYTALLDCLME